MIEIIKEHPLYQKFILWRDERITHSLFKKEYGKQIKLFKDKHKGQRCFIIGNGPSLRVEDLELLKDEITFASNYIFKMYDQTQWRPTYYCNSDLGVLQKIKNEPLFWKSEAKCNFFQYNARFILENGFPENSVCVYLRELKNQAVAFSSTIDKIVYDAATVTYIMLQLACYMGFSEIYLLGIDHNYSTTVDSKGEIKRHQIRDHFYSRRTEKDNDGGGVAFIEKMEKGYRTARVIAEKKKIAIRNVTRGGKLEIFERMNLEELFLGRNI